jgi:uncharacterized protein
MSDGPESRKTGQIHDGFLPGQVAIEAIGKGGFRFGGMSHKGSILALPTGIYRWDAALPEDISTEALATVFAEGSSLDILVLGTGEKRLAMPSSLLFALRAAKIGLEPMDSSNAARTYNVLLAEGRRVAAALLAIP